MGETSKAQPVALHVNFSLQKSDLETQNTGRVTLWNLNPSQLAVLNEKDCVVSLKAGYGSKLALIFAGIVSYVSTTIDSADRKTEIEVIDNLVEIRDTYVSVSYNGTVNWKIIFDDVAAQMGVAVSYSYNAEFADISNGFSFVGLARDIMTKGCKCCNLTWSLQNGVMQVKKPGDVMSREVYVLSPDTGLLGIPARVVITQDEATGKNTLGWDVEYFLNGAINIDDYVKLESDTVTGYFRVYSLEISGDNVSGDWICKARLLEVS
ncbi:MAG: hypothetical protein ACLUVS_06895 [Oscillospiraceae bacterium]